MSGAGRNTLLTIKFKQFYKAIGVVDVAQQLATRAAKEITAKRLEAREDLFKGGEVTYLKEVR